MDFIVKLAEIRKEHEYIRVVAARFPKLPYFILLPNPKAIELAKKFLKKILRLHRIHKDIISD